MVNFGFKCSDDLVNEWLKKKKNKSKTIVKALTNEYQKELNQQQKDRNAEIEVVIDG